MAYNPTNWSNREVEKPRTYTMVTNPDGTVTLTPSEGQVFTPGTPIDAAVMNKIETQLVVSDTGKVEKAGDVMTGPLTATVINATNKVQEAGVDLATKYQPVGSYAPTGAYVTWSADPNGVYLNVGTGANGKAYKVFLTSAQPAAGGTGERRVWIQTDA